MILFLSSSASQDARWRKEAVCGKAGIAKILSTLSCQIKGDPEALEVRTHNCNLKHLYQSIGIFIMSDWSTLLSEELLLFLIGAWVFIPGSILTEDGWVPLQSCHPPTLCDGIMGCRLLHDFQDTSFFSPSSARKNPLQSWC